MYFESELKSSTSAVGAAFGVKICGGGCKTMEPGMTKKSESQPECRRNEDGSQIFVLNFAKQEDRKVIRGALSTSEQRFVHGI